MSFIPGYRLELRSTNFNAATSMIYQSVLLYQFGFFEMKPSNKRGLKKCAFIIENIENSLEIICRFLNQTFNEK